MKKITKVFLNVTLLGAIVLIATLNASQFAVMGLPTPDVGGKPITESAGPRFIQPTEDNRLPGNRQPGTHAGGNPCDQGKIRLTALVPENKVGRTVSEYPRFFFYLPQSDAQIAEFVLEDQNGKQIYQTNLNINNYSGVIGVNIPTNKNVSPLQIGKNYSWSIALICDDKDRSADLFEKGIVRRVEVSTDIRSQLEKAEPRLKAIIYAKNGIWQDALSTLVAARRANPNDADLAADWKILLDSVNLGEIVAEPIAPIDPKP
jgi:Domain of Unknown Function (DUF928)